MEPDSFNAEIYPKVEKPRTRRKARTKKTHHLNSTRGTREVPTKGPTGSESARAFCEWIPGLNTRADLTLKKWIRAPAPESATAARTRLISLRDDEDAVATVVRMMNRLNCYVLKGERHRKRLEALVFFERSTSGSPHVHALIGRPADVSERDFAKYIARAWDAQPFGNRQKKIEPVRDLYRSVRYNAKFGQDRLIYMHRQEVGQ